MNHDQRGRVKFMTNAGPRVLVIQQEILVRHLDLLSKSVAEIAGHLEEFEIKGKPGCGSECAIAEYFFKVIRNLIGEGTPLYVSVSADSIEIAIGERASDHGYADMVLPIPDDSSVQRFIGEFDDEAFPSLLVDDDE